MGTHGQHYFIIHLETKHTYLICDSNFTEWIYENPFDNKIVFIKVMAWYQADHKPLLTVNTLRLWQHGHHFPDETFKCIFVDENVRIVIKISLTFVPNGTINNIQALVQIMAWHRPGD